MYNIYMVNNLNIHVYTCLPLIQLVLGKAHEELKERNQAPSVVWEQLVSETLFLPLYILHMSNQLVIRFQQHIRISIQLCHHLSHFPVLAHPIMGISKLHTSRQSTDS